MTLATATHLYRYITSPLRFGRKLTSTTGLSQKLINNA